LTPDPFCVQLAYNLSENREPTALAAGPAGVFGSVFNRLISGPRSFFPNSAIMIRMHLRYQSISRVILSAVAIAATLATSAALANGPCIRIEEDWELVLNTPDTVNASPQIVLEMTPETGSPLTGLFLINYGDTPDFSIGGFQLQLWRSGTNVATESFACPPFDVPGETIAFTLSLDRQSAGRLSYGIMRGTCKAWKDLGKLPDVTCTDQTSVFANYDSQNSVKNAQILCGEQRIKSLRLVQVRKYYANSKRVDTESGVVVYPPTSGAIQ
jgi:hypothetical protein